VKLLNFAALQPGFSFFSFQLEGGGGNKALPSLLRQGPPSMWSEWRNILTILAASGRVYFINEASKR